MDISRMLTISIKLFGYINTYFLDLNEPDKAWHISTSILYLDYKDIIKKQHKNIKFLYKIFEFSLIYYYI